MQTVSIRNRYPFLKASLELVYLRQILSSKASKHQSIKVSDTSCARVFDGLATSKSCTNYQHDELDGNPQAWNLRQLAWTD